MFRIFDDVKIISTPPVIDVTKIIIIAMKNKSKAQDSFQLSKLHSRHSMTTSNGAKKKHDVFKIPPRRTQRH